MRFLPNFSSALIIIFLASSSMFGQESNLDKLPIQSRESFQTRLEKYILYEVNGDWSKMFPLNTDYISNRGIPFLPEKKVSEADYVERRNSDPGSDGRLLRFSLSGVSLINGSDIATEWLVVGCGEFKKRKKRLALKIGFNAVHYNDDWYFSDINFLRKGVGENLELKCKMPKAKK